MRALAAAAILILSLLAAPAAAQAPAPLCRETVKADSAASQPDVMISASARIRELRFESQPRADLELTGCALLDSVRVERVNLPTPLQPGVTYRDVAVDLEAAGYLNVECLLTVPLAGAAGDSLRMALGRALAGTCAPVPDSAAAARRRP